MKFFMSRKIGIRVVIIAFVMTMLVWWCDFSSPVLADSNWPEVVLSKDGIPISYQVYGAGEQVLVFVHGWSCDSRYWKHQVPYFSKRYKVITLDLAGHGHSGSGRAVYSMESFGRDVLAVVNAQGLSKVILIGHSMGGPVIANAAAAMPEKVAAIIGVDTLVNVEYPMTKEQFLKMREPMEKDFAKGVKEFVKSMFRPDSDAKVRQWVLSDMPAAPKKVAMSALDQMMGLYITKQMATMFEKIHIPVRLVNADLWPVDFEANKRHISDFGVSVITNTDHFLMMNRPDEFNKALEKTVKDILNCQRTQ